MLPSAGSQGSAWICCCSSSSSPQKHHLVREQSSNSPFSQPTLLFRFTDLEIWPEVSTKIRLFWFLAFAVVLRYPTGKGLNEALLASRAILEQIRVCWVLVKDPLDVRYVGDGGLAAHSEGKLIYFGVCHLFQQPLGISRAS